MGALSSRPKLRWLRLSSMAYSSSTMQSSNSEMMASMEIRSLLRFKSSSTWANLSPNQLALLLHPREIAASNEVKSVDNFWFDPWTTRWRKCVIEDLVHRMSFFVERECLVDKR